MADLYLDPVNGSDTNDGSEGLPWASLRHANTAAEHGDTLHLAADTTSDDPEPIHIRKDLTITGPATAILSAELAFSGGCDCHLTGLGLRQTVHTANSLEAQLSVFKASLSMIDVQASYQDGGKSFVRSEGGNVYITAEQGSFINYSNNALASVFDMRYGAFLFGCVNGGGGVNYLAVYGGSSRVIYTASSGLSWLTGVLRGGGPSVTGAVVQMNRACMDGYVGPNTRFEQAWYGVQVTNGPKARVDPGAAFVGITTQKWADAASQIL